MKKRNALLALAGAGVISLSTYAQELDWVSGFIPMTGVTVHASAIDAAGNIYTTGYFDGTVDFDPGVGTYNLTSAGSYDIFIAKLDASGNLLWAKSMGSTNTDYGTGVALDASGNAYFTGYFLFTVDFDPGSGTFNMTSAGSDVFILKVDAAGNFIWAKKMGGSDTDGVSDIAVSASGNVYTTGNFRLTADFDPGSGTFNLTAAGSADIFISKLDAAGNFVWAKKMGGTNPNGETGVALVVDAAENIYTTGFFEGTVDFDPGTGTTTLTSAGQRDIFYSKLDVAGNFMWAKKIGGTGGDEPYDLAIDASGNLHSTGSYDGTVGVDFDPGTGTVNMISAGSWDIYVNKLDASGNYVWAKSMGGTDSNERGFSVAVDASGNVYTTGAFWGTADFDPGTGVSNLVSGGYSDIFISKLDASGNYIWAHSFGAASLLFDEGRSINISPSGSIYTAGKFQGTVDFDPGPGTANLSGPSSLATSGSFIQKLNQCASVTYTENITICLPFTWRDGVTYTTSQTGINHTVNGVVNGGCDSIYVLNLTIASSTVLLSSLTQADNSCFGSSDGAASVNVATGGSGSYTYDWTPGNPAGDGTTAVSGLPPGTWTCTATDANGCAASQSFTIVEPAAITGSFTHTACDSYTWNVQSYTASGIYTQILTAANGCDSTVTLNLTITNATSGVDIITACDSYVWIDGNTYTSSNNTATHLLTNSAGCDSTVTLNLTITNSTSGVDLITACDSYVWIDGNTYTASNNTATHLLTNNAGCDSTVTLNLTINTTPTVTATDNGSGTITASTAASYQWIDCITNQPLPGETGATFSPVVNGTYAVIGYSAQQCADTSNCVVINYMGIAETGTVAWNIMPNPANSAVTVTFNERSADLIIRDIQGKPVATAIIHSGETISLEDLSAGVYLFELTTAAGKSVKRVLKM